MTTIVVLRRPRIEFVAIGLLGVALVAGCGGSHAPQTVRKTKRESPASTQAAIFSLAARAYEAKTRCLNSTIRYSTDGRWALVQVFPRLGGGCPTRQAGSLIVRKQAERWAVVFTGSSAPPCSLGAPKELTQCEQSPARTQPAVQHVTGDYAKCVDLWNTKGLVPPAAGSATITVNGDNVSQTFQGCTYTFWEGNLVSVWAVIAVAGTETWSQGPQDVLASGFSTVTGERVPVDADGSLGRIVLPGAVPHS